MHCLPTSISQVLHYRTPNPTRKEHCVLYVCVNVCVHVCMHMGSTLIVHFGFLRYGLPLDLLLINLAVTNRLEGAAVLCQHGSG